MSAVCTSLTRTCVHVCMRVLRQCTFALNVCVHTHVLKQRICSVLWRHWKVLRAEKAYGLLPLLKCHESTFFTAYVLTLGMGTYMYVSVHYVVKKLPVK